MTPRHNQIRKIIKVSSGAVDTGLVSDHNPIQAFQNQQMVSSGKHQGNPQQLGSNLQQIQTQRNNYYPQNMLVAVYSSTSSQFSVKNSSKTRHNLPLIRNESLDLHSKEQTSTGGAMRYQANLFNS